MTNNESDHKTAKKLIKIYKKKPNLYGEADVMYARMIRKIYKKKKKSWQIPLKKEKQHKHYSVLLLI